MLDQGPTLLQCDLIVTRYVCSDSISKLDYILRYWGLGFQHIFRGGDTIQPIMDGLSEVGFCDCPFSVADCSLADQYLLSRVSEALGTIDILDQINLCCWEVILCLVTAWQ